MRLARSTDATAGASSFVRDCRARWAAGLRGRRGAYGPPGRSNGAGRSAPPFLLLHEAPYSSSASIRPSGLLCLVGSDRPLHLGPGPPCQCERTMPCSASRHFPGPDESPRLGFPHRLAKDLCRAKLSY